MDDHIPKFSGPIFAVFADKRLSAKLDPQNSYDCTVYNGHDCTRPRKLNHVNFEDWPSVKLDPTKISCFTVCSSSM
jgi:hypothetical protein